ncbi:MAG: hypothetical protein JWM68_4567 [Verrucomicrobiales bacterium]|nr:hypothetical protein [Verrucomicrobiales bacterium]
MDYLRYDCRSGEIAGFRQNGPCFAKNGSILEETGLRFSKNIKKGPKEVFYPQTRDFVRWRTRFWEAKRSLLRGRQDSGRQKGACHVADEILGSKKEPAARQTRFWEAKRGLPRGGQDSGRQKGACRVADKILGSKKEPAAWQTRFWEAKRGQRCSYCR